MLLLQEHKHSYPGSCFGTRGEQSEISHIVSTAIWDLLLQDVDKLFVREPHRYQPIISRVLGNILNRFLCLPRQTVLGHRWSSNVPSYIFHEMCLGHR
jgi:hypothetical protein